MEISLRKFCKENYKEKIMLYFAYGSNMSIKRLTKDNRIPSAVVKTAGFITGHILKFNKVSTDKSGKGHIEDTGNQDDSVHGVVYEIDEREKGNLHEAEGLGKGYNEKTVTVSTSEGEIRAVTYYATKIDDSLKPYTWYMNHVITGAKENNLPEDYITKLEQVDAIEDPNPELHDI
ncbi:MAG: gamma-glutamylcyclotransferase [bacterium]